jgi:hypothetical protein
MILLFVLFGLLGAFLSYSTYFSAKVSKGLTIPQLYDLVYTDPIGDPMLFYTFYNLFWCRISLIVSWTLAIGFGGAVYAFIR